MARLTDQNVFNVIERRIPAKDRAPALYYYEVRHSDCDPQGEPCTIENCVLVNFWGTVITKVPLKLNDRDESETKMPDYMDLTPEEIQFLEERLVN